MSDPNDLDYICAHVRLAEMYLFAYCDELGIDRPTDEDMDWVGEPDTDAFRAFGDIYAAGERMAEACLQRGFIDIAAAGAVEVKV